MHDTLEWDNQHAYTRHVGTQQRDIEHNDTYLSVMTLSITPSIMAPSKMALCIKIFSMSPTQNTMAGSKMTQPNGMLSVVILNVVVPNSPHPTTQLKKTKYL